MTIDEILALFTLVIILGITLVFFLVSMLFLGIRVLVECEGDK